MAERFNCTLKERLYRYFTAANTLRFADELPQLVQGYNATCHRSIGMAPKDVTWDNEEAVWKRLYEKRLKEKHPPTQIQGGGSCASQQDSSYLWKRVFVCGKSRGSRRRTHL